MPANPSFNAYIDHYMDRADAGYKRRPEYGGTVELPEELSAQEETTRVYKQGAGLQRIGPVRFMRLLRYVLDTGEHATPDVQRFLHAVDAAGISALEHRLNAQELVLEVRQLTADAFDVTFVRGVGEYSAGVQWSVVYNAKDDVLAAVRRGRWQA